ncbi:MAG: glycosyltransferase family 39 protein [Acidobacteria bacterium]|nr:glycosyltransferase family 39 protein [Acidobacteriota bacterium]
MTNRSERSFLDWLERNGSLAALGLLAIYLARAISMAGSRPLWFDEFFTFHLARLGSFSELWQALLGAADALPPLSYLLTRASHSLFGAGELATRLPSILGLALFSYCLFRLLRPRIGVLCALAAMAFSWLTWGFEYGIEARPYALMTGFAAAALLAWRELADGKQRRWNLAAMALSLAGAISLHYYAVFVFPPLAAGEAMRTWKTRKFDWPVWALMAASSTVLLAYLPLIHAARDAYSGGFWSPVHESDILGTYLLVLLPAAWPLGIVILLFSAAAFYFSRRDTATQPDAHGAPLPAHETAAFLMSVATPVFAVTLAYLTTGAYVYRYGLPMLVGLCAGFGVFVRRASRGHAGVQAAALAVLLGWFVLGGPRFVAGEQGRTDPTSADPYGFAVFQNTDLPADVPIAVSSPTLFPEHVHYAPDGLRDRLVYVADPSAALRYREADTPDRNLQGLSPWGGGSRSCPTRSFWRASRGF